jgi:hypothetical protein
MKNFADSLLPRDKNAWLSNWAIFRAEETKHRESWVKWAADKETSYRDLCFVLLGDSL